MRAIITFCFFIFSTIAYQHLSAQSTIQGTVTDAGNKPLKDASVLLLKYPDSSLVKGVLTDADGNYTFENIPKGSYIVSASFAGMQQAFSKMFTTGKGKINIETISLHNADIALTTVTVAAPKPMFEQKIDRMVINVKNSITAAGGTALDVLSKSPGVTVNMQDNTVSVNGKNGVVVMINDKITYMPMDALIQLLSGISASNIDKIELITTPPAKYDAAGNAGYINIVLINNPYQGANGSYFLSGGYGKGWLGSAGGNFNYRTQRINLSGNYNYNYIQTLQPGTGFTQLTKGSDIITNNSFTNRKPITQVHNIRLGLDYQLDTSTVIGALISGYNSVWKMKANNGSAIQTNGVLDTTIITTDHETNHWQNIMGNLNFQHTFKPGTTLSFDANYIYYKDNNPNIYFNQYYKGTSDHLYDENVRSGKITPIHFKVFSTDYTTTINEKITMEAGAKVSLSKFTNDVNVQNLEGGAWITDPELSADYLLKENIGAAYASFNMSLNSKTNIKAGLRYEYTSSNLGTKQTADIVNKKYGELFPTFYISRKINDNNSINLSYSRRITRPTFNALAPFTIFFTPKLYFTGNPALQPAIANTVQASYTFKNYMFSLSYTYEKNTIENFQTQKIDSITHIVYYSAQNSKYEQYATAGFSIPVSVTPWWAMQNNFNVDWRQVNVIYNNSPVRVQIFDYDITSVQHFTLNKDLSFELTGFYTSAGYFGTNKLSPIYQVDAGLQKKISKRDILRISANDMFNSGGNIIFKSDLPIDGTIVKTTMNFGSVAYKLTWTHSFGNRSLKVKGQRSSGAEEELNRVRNN